MLARRELSEAQVRQRLSRKGYDPDSIEDAISRLKANRSIDDTRVAGMIARMETGVRGRGKPRVRRQIEAAGIAPAIAARAVEETFQDIDADALLAAALDKRLRGRDRLADDKEFRRLYRYLVAQGFEPDRIVAILRRHQ